MAIFAHHHVDAPEHLLRTIDEAIALSPDHLSLYLLELYPNAPLKDAMAREPWSQAPDDEAADMYLTAAAVAPESPWGRRALVGAVRSLVMAGNRAAAETIYRQLVESADGEPEILEQARQALRARPGETSRRGR